MSEADLLESHIAELLANLAQSSADNLAAMSKDELERQWHFRWDESLSVEWNVYRFHDLLGLYGRFCRQWEERHNGSQCVVERVRDTYLMPKIRGFLDDLRAHGAQPRMVTREAQGRIAALEAELRRVQALCLQETGIGLVDLRVLNPQAPTTDTSLVAEASEQILPEQSLPSWSKTQPTEKGVYVWKGSASMFALVLVHRRPSQCSPGGILKGMVLADGGSKFYDGCAITDWSGEWIGPLPK